MVRETRHLWVGNLPDNIREDRIREHFKRYGRVQSIKLLPRSSNNASNNNNNTTTSTNSSSSSTNNKEETATHCGNEGTMACTVAFMDIKSASKAHNAEHKLDDRTLTTEYYEPAAIPSAASPQNCINSTPSSAYSTSSPVSIGVGGGGGGGIVGGGGVGTRFPNGHGSSDDHVPFSDRFYDRPPPTSRLVDSGDFIRRASGSSSSSSSYHGRSARSDRASVVGVGGVVGGTSTYRNGPSSYNSMMVERSHRGAPLPPPSASSLWYDSNNSLALPPQSTSISSSSLSSSNRYNSSNNSSSDTTTGYSSLSAADMGGGGGTTTTIGNSNNSTTLINDRRSQIISNDQSSTKTHNNKLKLITTTNTTTTTSSSTSITKSRSGSRSPSPSGSTSSRSPSSRSPRSRSTSSSSSSTTSTSRDTSSSSSEKRPVAIRVKNLPPRSSDSSLKDGLFHEYKKHGKVTWVKVVGQGSERYAIVCFKKPEDVDKALEVSHDKLFFGCKIDVEPYQGYDVEDNDLRPYEAEIDEFHPKATRTLFIGNLEKDITASDLRKHFDQFGEIIEIDIKKQGAVGSYAFCQYSDIVSVVKAIRTMDGEHLGNNRIKLGFGKSMPTNCVWVDGVVDVINEKYLRIQFEPFGSIGKVHVDRDKGQALIFYEQVSGAQLAVNKMRGFNLKGCKIQVDFASRECQESFFEHLDKQQGVGGVITSSTYDEQRGAGKDIISRSFEPSSNNRFSRYDTPTRPRTSSYSSRGSASSNQPPAVPSPGGTPGSLTPRASRSRTLGRYSDYYESATTPSDYADRHFLRNYDEYSQGSGASHEDGYDHDGYPYANSPLGVGSAASVIGGTIVGISHHNLDAIPSSNSDHLIGSSSSISSAFLQPDIRNLQKERVHLLEQLEELPSSGDELISPKKRLKLDHHHHLLESNLTNLSGVNSDVLIETTSSTRGSNSGNGDHHHHRKVVMEVRRLSDPNLLIKHHSRRPSMDALSSSSSSTNNKHLMMHHERTSSSSYLPHAVCKRRKTGGSDSGGSSRTTSHQQQHYDHHSGGESVGGSRPGTPLVDERPEHFQPSEPRRIPREREGPLTLPLPRFAAQIMNQRGSISIAGIKGQKDNNVLSSPPPAVTSPRISHLAAISAAAAAASTTPSSIISSSSSQTLSTAMKHESPSLSSHLVPPPASPPPRPSSLSSNSSSDSTPPSPSLDERIRSLDEKYEKWSGSRAATNVNCNNSSSSASTTIVVGSGNNSTCGGSSTSNNAITTSNLLINSTNLNSSSGTNSVNCLGGNNAVACGNDVLAKLDATREKFRLGHKLLDLDLKEVQPSDIVKSVMAKRSVFDEDLKRLENVGEKYEPKDFCGFTTTTTTTSSSSSRTLTSTTSTASTTTLSLTITTTTNSSSGLTTSSATSSPLLAPSPSILKLTTTNLSGNVSSSGGVPPKTPTMLSPRSAGGANVTAAKGLQYPFPSHPPTTLSQQTLSPTPIVVTSTTTSTSSLLLASTTCNITTLTATTTTSTSKLITSSLSSSSSSHGHGDTNRLKSCVTSGGVGGVNSVGGINSSENSNRTSNIHNNNNNSKVMSVNKQTTIIKTSEKTSDTTSTPQQQQQQIVKSSSDGNNSNNSGINKSDNNKILCRRDSNSNSPRNVGGGISSSSSNSSNSSTTGGEVIKSRRNSDATTIINKRISSDDNNSEIIMETKQQEQKPEKERNDKDATTIQKECEKEGKDDDSKSVVVELQAQQQQHPRKDNHEKSSSRHRHHSNDERSSKTKDNASIKENHNTPNDSSKSSRHLSIDFDRTKSSSYTDNKSLSSSSSDLSKRKERNNSLASTPPSSGGLKRRLSTHESITNDNNGSSGVNDEKKLKLSNDHHHHHHNKRLSERRDSKDSQRSDDKSSSSKSSSGSSSKHKSTNLKSSSLSYNEDKQKIKDHQQQQDKHKQQKQMQKIEKHKIKSKSREKDLTPNSKESAAAASALSDKDFMARLDLRSNEEIDKQKRKDKDKLDQQQRYDDKKSTSSSLSDKKDRDKCKSNRSESESTTPKSLSSNNNDDLLQQQRNKIKKEHHQQQQQHQQQQNQQQQQQQQHHHHRIRKLTHNNSSDNSDSDEPKKHSIFDIVDDEPAYISMYDKVKARSCKNMQKQEEEKRQEKIKAKFSQLKQSRAKREEKKRSTSWDEDSDSDKDKMTTMNKSRSGKMCIMSSDEEETNSVISRKSTSSSHHHKKQMEIYTDSDSEQRQSKFKSSSSHHHHHHHHHHRITSDTSDDDMKKIQNQIKSEIFSDDNEIDQGFADSDDKLLYKSSQIKKEKIIKQESSTSLVEQMNAQIFGDSSSPDVKVEPTSNRYNNNNRHHENSSADENNMDIKKERSSSTSNSSEIRKKHKKKQKRQKYSLSSSEETTVTTPTMIKTENLDGTTIVNDENKSNKHHDKKKQHSKKDKKRDKSHSSTPKDERDKEKSSSSSSSLRKSKKNKDGTSSTLTKSESKRDGSKMENIFGSLSEDSEGGLKENELSENNKNYDRHHHKFETNYNSDSDREQRQQQQQDKTKIEEKEREAAAAAVAAAQAVAAKEEHRKRKEKKRREKERRLQEEAAAAAAAAAAATVQLLSEPINENSMDYADMGKQLEANIKDDSMEETSKINQDAIENTNSNTEDAFRFNSNDFADKKDDYHRSSKEAREKKKKRKKSKEEKQKHHHHHHHDKTKKSSSSSASSASIPSADVVVKKEFSEIKIEIDECKQQQQPSLPNLDPSSPQPQNKSATSSNLDYSISPIPRDNVLLSPIPKTPTTTGSASNKEKKREKFIPGFGGTEIDEKIHENAIKSISEDFVDNSILSPTKHSSELLINQSIIDEVKPIQAATNNDLLLSTTNEEKPRVVISQEETEDAVAALLGESFGGDNDNEQSQFTECYNQNDENLTSVEDNSQLNQIVNENGDEEEEVVVASQDDEEMRQAVQSLSSAVTPDTSSNIDDAKPETPQSEHELQIDTDTEECDENSLQTTTSTTTTTTTSAIISKSPGIIMEKSKTIAEINYLHHDKINNIGSPPSLAPITPKQDIIVETAKSLSLPLLPEQRSGVISQAPASTTTSTPPPFHLTEKKKDVEISKIVTPTTIVYPPLTAISPIPSKSVDIPEPIIVNKIVHNLPIVSAASTPPYVTKTLATVPPSQSTITTSSNLTPLAATTQINRLPITPIMVSKPMQAATVILSQPKIAVEQHQSMLVVSSPSSSLSTRIMSPITSTINTTCAITTPSQSVAIRMPPRTTFAYVPPYSSSSATIVGTKELDKVQNPTSNIIKQQTIIMATSTAAPPAVVTPSISNVIKEAPPKLIGLNQQLQQQTSSAAAVIQQVKPQLIDNKESKIHEEHYHHHHHNLKVVDFASLHHKSTSSSPVIVQTATIINKEAPPIIENKLKDIEKDKIDDNIDTKLAIAQVTDELNLTLKKNDEIKTETKDEEEINKNVVGDNNVVENKIDDNDHSKEIKCEFKMEIKEERLFAAETKLEDKNKDWSLLTKPQDKEVNIDSVIKTLCSSEDLTNKPSITTINKEEWQMNESKPSQTELFATSESKIEDLTIKKEELVSNDNSANTPAPTVPQTEQQQQQFVDDDQQHQDDVNKEIASTRGGRRGGRGARGRKSRASAGNCSERGGIQTRRGGKTLGAISTATSTTCSTVTTSTPCKQRGAGGGRGGTRPRGERKNSKSESETSTTPPAAASSDVYEFRDDSDDANNKERPRLILTIKSPAVASTNTPTSMQTTTTTSTAPVTAAILKDITAKEIATTNITPVTTSISPISSTLTTPTTTASGSLSKEASPVPSPAASIPSPAASIQSATSGSETKDEFLSPVANTRKSRRLQERDVLRNTVDDTIEDVVRNTVMVTRSSSSAQNAARRSARQAAAAGGKPTAAAGPTSSSPINASHNNNALMQQENLARKSPRSSTAAGGATIARRKDRRLSDPSLSHEDNSNDEKIKSDGLDANKSNEGGELKDAVESTGTSLVQATSALGKCEENKMEMLKDGFKGAMLRRVKSEMNNQQPVALIDPFTGELTPMHECEEGLYIPVPKSGSTTTASAATTKVVANESNTVITQSSSILHQPQQQQQIKSKPHSLKAHVLSSTVTVPQVQPKTVVAAIAAAPQTPHANPIVVVPQQPTTPLPVKKSIIVTQNLQQQQQQQPINFNAAAAALKRQYTTVELLCGQDLPPHMKSQKQQQQSQQIVQKQQIVTSKPMIVSSAMVPQQQHQMINAQVGHLKLGNLSQQQQNIKQAVISKVKPTPILHGSTTNSPPSIGNAGKLVAGPIPGMVATPPPLPTPTSTLQQQNHIVVPPKIDVGNVILSGMKAKPVPPRQQQQYNFPSAPVTSLGEAIAHFPGAVPLRPPPHDLPPAHYMHPSNVMQFPYLRQNYHLPRSPMVPAGAALLEKSDGQEGEEAPVTSPPLELRRPGSVGLALTAAARTTAVVPHSLHSPHDRTTDSPQIGQVYNMHTARMQPQHYHRYYDQAHPQQSAEPPPAHRPLTSHGSLTALATEAHMLGAPDRPLSSSMQQQQPDRPLSNLSAAIAHAHMSSLSGSAAAVAAQTTHLPPERPLSNHGLVTMGAGLGAAGNLMGAVARHVGVDAPASQRNLQAATPPHASQVPPQAESLFMLLKQYPCMWQGLLALKNDQAAVQMYFVSGNDMVAKCSLPRNMDGSTPPLRVFQRMRLEPPQVEGVARKMQMENEHCMLLALPCGHDHMDVLIQSMNLTNGFITYLQQKQAAGIVNVAAPGTTTPPAYVVHIFPSCDFVNTNLRRIAPSLLERVSDLAHLLIVITTV